MNLSELKKLNPGLYAQCIEEGVAQERARCSALLPRVTKYTPPMTAYAIKCANNGSDMGNLQKATYMSMQLSVQRKKAESEKVVSLVEQRLNTDPNIRNEYH